MAARLLAIIALLALTGSAAAAVTSKQVQGTWEAARSPEGTAPGLKPVGKPDPDSGVRGAILWKAPHGYQRKTAAPTSGESSAPVAPAVGD